ncbi:4-coumarate-CoA ligase-like protein [Zopfia rhizophila CBS 207.26]|uniref:4-coumarate-CoA ligase-like protein n=1 Tax=Zopfia rhizophila CBS 207.26 TaxID=1314779 RepID=A0A6A6EA84_9PEZI|nr:4-coumarate-CoA ligase-like protein [Zopfia rhizophila CBS 207.26]
MPFLAQEHIKILNKDLLSWIFDDQKFGQDKPIYTDAADPSRSICSRQARTIVRKLCAGFKAIGLQKDDCVCMLSFNDIYYSMAFLGIVAAGCIFGGTNPSHTPHELSHAFKIAKVRALIVEPELLPNALRAAKMCNIPRSRIFVFDHHTPLSTLSYGSDRWSEELGSKTKVGGLKSWRSLMGYGERDWERWDDEKKSRDTTAARLFSSGTTGMPKALDMTHYNFIAQHSMVMEWKHKDYEVSRLLCTPMFHVSNVPRAHTSPLRGGYSTYIMRRFELEPWLRNIERYQITEINMVPPMVIQALNSPLTKKYSLKSVRYAWVGAAPLAAEPQARFKALLRPDTPFNQVWGMSETSCIATMIPWPEHDPTGSVGRFLPNLDAKLVDENGADITDYDVAGELCVRGPLIVKQYFGNPEANALSWDKDNYFHTGDIAVRKKKNGLWYIVDRKKELIKVRGFQVAPAELEGVLLEHKDIADAAVVGVPAGEGSAGMEGSELPRAYLVVKKGRRLSEGDIQGYMKEILAGYKQLEGGVRFMDAIPKNASGKILKKDLKRMALKEVGAKL